MNTEFSFASAMIDKASVLMGEAEFKLGGFVYKHIEGNNPDPIRAVQSAVDRMRELHDIEDHEFNPLCQNILVMLQQKVGKS
tara:strand:+ start:2439 stop:2684 length:246 start_codon:yes stop_codon:yes gene_type:complete